MKVFEVRHKESGAIYLAAFWSWKEFSQDNNKINKLINFINSMYRVGIISDSYGKGIKVIFDGECVSYSDFIAVKMNDIKIFHNFGCLKDFEDVFDILDVVEDESEWRSFKYESEKFRQNLDVKHGRDRIIGMHVGRVSDDVIDSYRKTLGKDLSWKERLFRILRWRF